MNRALLALAASLALSGCAPGLLTGLGGGPPAPVTVADRTVLDEQGLLGLELAYKAARMATEAAVDFGVLKGDTAAKVARLDNDAFTALGVARRAYRGANAADYDTALREAQATLGALIALAGK